MVLATQWMTTMTIDEKSFYTDLGKRIAHIRKTQNLTQTQLAEQLGIAQQTMAHYEGGSLRISVATLLAAAEALKVSVDDVLYESAGSKAKAKRGPDSRLQQQIEKIRQLPRTKQQFVMEMLDTVIQQSSNPA
jgi:transcriptional regulator with XRE-family HTH domain